MRLVRRMEGAAARTTTGTRAAAGIGRRAIASSAQSQLGAAWRAGARAARRSRKVTISHAAGEYGTDSHEFLRANVALISNDALSGKIKDTDGTLLERIKDDTGLSEPKEEEPVALPQDDDETAFGEKAIKEFLLSLNPSECEFKQGGYFDNYYYVDEFIADYLYDELSNYIKYVDVKEDKGMWRGTNSGTRVACVESDVYGRNVCVATFYEGGSFYEKVFVVRPR